MFTCKERVVRDGRLVCFAGQVMSEEEAEALGLAGGPASPGEAPKAPTISDLKAELDELGVAYDKRAKKGELEELLKAAKSAQPVPDPDEGGDPADPDEGGDPADPDDPEGDE